MEERTRAYLRGRFGDHYGRASVSPPPAPNEREWGHIPWTSGSGTTMVRHRSWLDVGDLEGFLERERPRHVYFSAGTYDDPGASSMSRKGWRGADLVFDLDADHLPGVDPDETTYGEMLAACKGELLDLLSILETDFGFEDLTVVFSGGRGYHVHVRDDGLRTLDRGDRREIVEYVLAEDLDLDALLERELVAGMGLENPTEKRTLSTTGGWGKRVHDNLLALVDDVRALDEDDAMERLQSYDGIGEGSASKLVDVFERNDDQIRHGNVEVHGRFLTLARQVAAETFREESAPIDEPVTTDINRLIRLPGSLHGGTGLSVERIERDEVADFDPLVDAVPETFTGETINVDVHDPGTVELLGDTFRLEAGAQSVPEYVGIFAMARGRAEKARE
ncbi:DNA primase small subunit PriS [Halorubellus sp. JP-L1]|uniref:DNA primase small subunit PriS n=1 Tax=Halorubellus sp. JP-L1 TaxID=2715753 RepID=UPI0014075E18|nr:DNA primase small subunit PriS [Halorubellus sp. JP-L1]NHN41037.1 DNA primase small subunit PriS [Halorubellus sp. JP-L1]